MAYVWNKVDLRLILPLPGVLPAYVERNVKLELVVAETERVYGVHRKNTGLMDEIPSSIVGALYTGYTMSTLPIFSHPSVRGVVYVRGRCVLR